MPGDEQRRQMAEEISAQVELLREGWHGLQEQAVEAVGRIDDPGSVRVHLVGCGDSHQAGLATRLAFAQWAGVSATAHLAMEFSEYAVPMVGKTDVVIPVSSSGRVARTIEAAARARAKGARVIAVTGDTTTPLAAEADAIIGTSTASSVGVTPGTHSFMASMLACWAVAHALASVRGRSDEGAPARMAPLLNALPRLQDQTLALPDEWIDRSLGGPPMQAIGGGPAWGMALYAQMKFLEAAARPILAFELEEWAHSGFFLTHPGSPLLLLAPAGQSMVRAREILGAAAAMGCEVVVIAPEDTEWDDAAEVIALPPGVPEALSPAMLAVPVQRLSLLMGERQGATPLGFDNPRRREINFQQIFESPIRREPPEWG